MQGRSASRFVAGHSARLLENGAEFFPALRAAIEAAEREILLETYILKRDEGGEPIISALLAAARRGVAVYMLVDGFGSRHLESAQIEAWRQAGLRVYLYRPYRFLHWNRLQLRRLHRKLAVVDGRVAFVGGINLQSDYDAPNQAVPRLDYAVRVEGPLVAAIRAVMRRLWRAINWARLGALGRDPPVHLPMPRVAGPLAALFLWRDNLRHRYSIERAYLDAILSARDEVLIANAYFVPGRRFRRALKAAAMSGVRVRLLLQGRVDHIVEYLASRALYGDLLAAGVEIHEYRAALLHAKVAVVDSRWCTVGSSNIDPFSLLAAREANLAFDDPDFAAQLKRRLEAQIAAYARAVNPDHWRRRAWHRRLLAWLAYGVVRHLVGLSGYWGFDASRRRRR